MNALGGSLICIIGGVLLVGFIVLANSIRIVPEYQRLVELIPRVFCFFNFYPNTTKSSGSMMRLLLAETWLCPCSFFKLITVYCSITRGSTI